VDNRFLQWLIGGLFVLTVAAFVAGKFQGDLSNGVVVTSCTTLIATIIGASAIGGKKKP
jgi:Mg/Co/Ni transporter MgtE